VNIDASVSETLIPSKNSFFRVGLLGAAHVVEKGVAITRFAPACIYGGFNGFFDRMREHVRGDAEPSALAGQIKGAYDGSLDVTGVAMQRLGMAALPFVADPILTHTLSWNAVGSPFNYFHRAGLVGVGAIVAKEQISQILKAAGFSSDDIAADPQSYADPVFAMAKVIESCLARARKAGVVLNNDQENLIRQATVILEQFKKVPHESWGDWIESQGKELEVFAEITTLFPEGVEENKEVGPSAGSSWLSLSVLGSLAMGLGGNAIRWFGRKLWDKGDTSAVANSFDPKCIVSTPFEKLTKCPAEVFEKPVNHGFLVNFLRSTIPFGLGLSASKSFKDVGSLAADAANTGYSRVFGGSYEKAPEVSNPWYDPEAVKKARGRLWSTKSLDAAYVATKVASMGVQTMVNLTNPLFSVGILAGAMPGLTNMLMGPEEKIESQEGDHQKTEKELKEVQKQALLDHGKEKLVDETPPSLFEMERRQFHDLSTKAKIKDLGLFALKETGNVVFSAVMPSRFPSFEAFKTFPSMGVGNEVGQLIGQWVPNTFDKAAGVAEKWIPVDKESMKMAAYTGMNLTLLGFMAYHTGVAGKVAGWFAKGA